MKHNAELSATINVYTRILTKQLLRKIDSFMTSVDSLLIKDKIILKDYKEEILELSESLTTKEPCICFYLYLTNIKSKLYKKSRRCIICQKLTIVYYGYCTKAYCYAIGSKKHDCICLKNYVREMKMKNRGKHIRSQYF